MLTLILHHLTAQSKPRPTTIEDLRRLVRQHELAEIAKLIARYQREDAASQQGDARR
jgi:hypothetical protein